MATRSRIAIKTETGYKSVYCHFDGGLWHNGQVLADHFQNPVKAMTLVLLGDLSILNKDIIPNGPHDFGKPEMDVCVFYGRDRGEMDVGYKFSPTLDDLEQVAENCGAEYIYIMEDGIWFYAQTGRTFKELAPAAADFKAKAAISA
jgi:hypothetical protein